LDVIKGGVRGDRAHLVDNERSYLPDIAVLIAEVGSATATYNFDWEGSSDGRELAIGVRGTCVLVGSDGELAMKHEQMSHPPR
jgi:hypothetical protein